MKVNLNPIPLFKGKAEVPQSEKKEYLRKRITEEMKREDEKDKGVNIPCFMRAETKLNNIEAAGMVDSEYKKYVESEV